ncbi:probable DEAD-box ATP-dependent RNA helicase 48 [Phalaenopsis equestris]|uniref:probable DEAD-box ATP-dependent RNA helicase 48 n=1 Tax=Phalaenopsis equestris TaxID=78828 RepID=UPI0009E369AA|nr:probable DEAD-box ATP-dependent RNA helicase 48 [Phalaenopsis equestris]
MPSAVILPASIAIPRSSNRSLCSCGVFTGTDIFQSFSIATTSFTTAGDYNSLATIRMGGGPRTYPGGVSKWQWKRMQAKKSKQLLKARLCRERQLYEMRKRAELKAAISELERPWEVVERAPVLFSTSADEQIKALADRFQRSNGFDMWSERDGPQLFRSPDDLPSVHSLKPRGVVMTAGRRRR